MATMATMNGATWCLTVAVALGGVSPAVAQEDEDVSDASSEVLGLVGRMSGDGRTSIIGSDGTGNSIIITSGGVGLRLTRTWDIAVGVLQVPVFDGAGVFPPRVPAVGHGR